MPVQDPRAGQAFICLVTFFLFASIAVGGGCLIAYTVLPYPPAWLSYVGIASVCLPWLFWLLTFLYRTISRAFGFRMVIGGGEKGNMSNTTLEAVPDHLDPAVGNKSSPVESAVGGGEHEGNKSKKRALMSSNSSVVSHESEKPLAISMAV